MNGVTSVPEHPLLIETLASNWLVVSTVPLWTAWAGPSPRVVVHVNAQMKLILDEDTMTLRLRPMRHSSRAAIIRIRWRGSLPVRAPLFRHGQGCPLPGTRGSARSLKAPTVLGCALLLLFCLLSHARATRGGMARWASRQRVAKGFGFATLEV